MRCAKLVLVVAIIGVFLTAGSLATAATSEEIEASIVNGLAWLASQQNPDGSWGPGPTDISLAMTGLAVLKFEEHAKSLGKNPFDPSDYQYAQNVIDGLNFIFYWLISETNGVHFPKERVGEWGLDVSPTGIAMMAIAASSDPDRVVEVDEVYLPGEGVVGWTYQNVLQGMTDWMAYAQNTGGCEIGGWGNGGTSGLADNSNSGYATKGLAFAGMFGIAIPVNVVSGLSDLIGAVQVTSGEYAGGSMYDPCDPMGEFWGSTMVNIAKTGNLLVELKLAGDDAGSARVENAIGFIETYWDSPGGTSDGGGWQDDYQAMFTMTMGLEAYGIETLTGGLDWFDEVSTHIVGTQNDDGSWGPTLQGDYLPFWGPTDDRILDTCWALLTLEKVNPFPAEEPEIELMIDVKPTSCPNPLNIDQKGVLPVAILGTQSVDVTGIDPESVALVSLGSISADEPLLALRYAYEDVATPLSPENAIPVAEGCECTTEGPDGYMDLTLKFDVQDLVAALGGRADLVMLVGQCLPLKLTATVGGQTLSAWDCVRIQASGKKR